MLDRIPQDITVVAATNPARAVQLLEARIEEQKALLGIPLQWGRALPQTVVQEMRSKRVTSVDGSHAVLEGPRVTPLGLAEYAVSKTWMSCLPGWLRSQVAALLVPHTTTSSEAVTDMSPIAGLITTRHVPKISQAVALVRARVNHTFHPLSHKTINVLGGVLVAQAARKLGFKWALGSTVVVFMLHVLLEAATPIFEVNEDVRYIPAVLGAAVQTYMARPTYLRGACGMEITLACSALKLACNDLVLTTAGTSGLADFILLGFQTGRRVLSAAALFVQ